MVRHREVIPTDSLVVGRKVMKGSATTVAGEVEAVVRSIDFSETPVQISQTPILRVNLIEKNEYAEKKLAHPTLGIWSVAKVVDEFNATLREKREGLNDYVSDIPLGEVDFEEVDEGLFVVGFLLGDDFRHRLGEERTEAIDTILDNAGLPPADHVRQWRQAEHKGFWLPVLTMATEDPDAEVMLEDLCGQLENASRSTYIDFFDAQASRITVDVPAPSQVNPQP